MQVPVRSNEQATFARVALPLPVDKLFTYEVPLEYSRKILVGSRVEVPFGKRILSGVVAEIVPKSDVSKTKPIRKVCDTYLPPSLLELTGWISSYYGCSLGEAAQSVLPPRLKRARSRTYLGKVVRLNIPRLGEKEENALRKAPKQLGLLRAIEACGGSAQMKSVLNEWGYSRACLNGIVSKGYAKIEQKTEVSPFTSLEEDVVTLTGEQSNALSSIEEAIGSGKFSVFLLHGVTGSGKTEVYLRAAKYVLARGGGCIVLVPEIGLLPQATARYKKLFGDKVAIIHSRLTGAERFDIWEKAKDGIYSLVLGPRSALFTPVKNLQLIVVDEEQDDSYKQEDKPRYHARNVALMRGKFENLTVVLGSATPSSESIHQVRKGRYKFLTLSKRIKGIPMPEIQIVDMRNEEPESGIFSRLLLEKLDECLKARRQSILFLNKRGHSRFVQCNSCGWAARCRNCDISLTYHRVGSRLKCHFCGFGQSAVAKCPECGSTRLFFSGIGTQRIEMDLKGLFPGISVLRMDADTTAGKEGHRRILEMFSTGRYHVLLGTQMVAKGHHFPGVHLVGILSAEEELNFPDFRSAERTFQQLIQVSGRAGRIDKRGEVLVQTFVPDHNVFKFLRSHDYNGFMEEELKVRKKLGYPPFSRLIGALCSSADEEVLGKVISKWAAELKGLFETKKVIVLGPAPPLIPRLKGRYREQLIIKGTLSYADKRAALESFRRVCTGTKKGRNVELKWDVDPQSFV